VSTSIVLQQQKASGEIMEVKQFSTTSVKEIQLIIEPVVESTVIEDIEMIYPMCKTAESAFAHARWLLGKNGVVAVILPLQESYLLQEITLTGFIRKRDGTTQIHTQAQGPRGLTSTLDGILIGVKGGYILKCLYTVQIRGVRHVELLNLRLGPATDSLPRDYVNSILKSKWNAQATDEVQPKVHAALFSEPDEFIGGVPVPMDYEVTISGNVDGTAFGPLSAKLLLRKVNDTQKENLQVTLLVDGSPVVPGWSFWVTHSDVSSLNNSSRKTTSNNTENVSNGSDRKSELIPTSGVSVKAKDGNINIEITPGLLFRQVGWYARNPDHPESIAHVNVETGKISLQCKGDKISGNIVAQGHILEGNRPVSIFNAKEIEGHSQGDQLLKMVKDVAGPRKFNGKWNITYPPKIGQLQLIQKESEIQGSFDERVTIKNGQVAKDILRFNWSASNSSFGKGFLRHAGNGLLVGMKWIQNANDSIPIVGVQKQLEGDNKDSTVAIRPPENDGEALALRFLGQDLAHADKHLEAVKVIKQVIEYYSQKANDTEIDPDVQYSCLISQGMPILTLVDSSFKAGDYNLLVDALDKALELHKELSQGSSGMLLFRDHVGKYTGHLSSPSDTINIALEKFEQALYAVNGAGIGILLEELPNIDKVKIKEITSDMPASRAGVASGDYLVAIDNEAIAGKGMSEILSRLRGSAGSVVKLALVRNGRQLEVALDREPLVKMPPRNRKRLSEALKNLLDLSEKLQLKLTLEAQAVERLSDDATQPKSALDNLKKLIKNLQNDLQKNLPLMIAAAEKAMADAPKDLSLFKRFVSLMKKQAQERQPKPELSKAILKLDKEYEEVKRRGESSDLDAVINGISCYMVSSIITLERNLADRSLHVDVAIKMLKDSPIPQKTQKTMAVFIEWLDRWWSQLATDPGKKDALHGARQVYDKYIQLLVEFGLHEKALEASETARSRAFRDLIASRNKKKLSETMGEKVALASLDTASSPNISEMKSLVEDTYTTVLEYYLLDDTLLSWVLIPPQKDENQKSTTIRLFQKKVLRTELKNLSEQFWWLTSMTSGAKNKEELFGWISKVPENKKDLKNRFSQELNKSRQNETTVVQADSFTAPNDFFKLHREVMADVLKELYSYLITPVSEFLPKQSDQVVTIVPHDILFRIPFAALLKAYDHKAESYDFFIEDHVITHTPSLAIMQMVRKIEKEDRLANSPSLLAVLNPAFNSNVVDSNGNQFQPLDKMEEDMKYVLNLYKKDTQKPLKGKRATTEAVLAQAPNYDVVIFATHAEALEDTPMDSYMALADEKLAVEEIAKQNKRWKAKLVILGACETGGGQVTGDGVEGLSRWMMAAGAKTLMTSLWKVPELETSNLIYFFHKAWLKDGMSMIAAMHHAQLELAEEHSIQVPLWAGFFLTGGWL
jgi:CHAT domain-containing protein